jgi:hypothetical protein
MGQGREAATVRQVILVVVLVAASFLGGAFVNGPGLRWVQTQLLGSLGISEGGEIASVDLKGGENADAPMDRPKSGKPAAETIRGPLAPVPSLVAEGETGTRSPVPQPVPGSPLPQAVAPAPAFLHPSVAAAVAASPPRSTLPRLPADPSVAPAVLSSPASPATPAARKPPGDAPPLPSSVPKSVSPPQAKSQPKLAMASGDDWEALHRRMQTLGVSRYTIEGQPTGRAVFSCLVPLAGHQAVAQRFEAEGEDAFRAAQAALRRLALWRATQPES